MVQMNQPPSWQLDEQDTYLPIFHEGRAVGFCKPDYARQIIETLNEEDRLRKALRLACYDLISRTGGSSGEIDSLVQQYLAKAERPKQGSALIALLLQERQVDLDISTQEFVKFCDSYKLSRPELQAIYEGQEINSDQLLPLSRILGMTVDEVMQCWQGKN